MSGSTLDAGLNLHMRDRWSTAQSVIRSKIDTWFPERQLLIRGPGNFTSLHLSQKRQLWVLGGLAAVVCWAVIATLGFAFAMERQAAEAGVMRQLVQAEAHSQAEIAQMQAATAALVRSRASDIAAADSARDQAIAHASAVIVAYDQKLAQLSSRTRDAIGEVETIIKSTGLDPQQMAPRPAAIAASDPSLRDAGRRVTLLLKDLAQLKSLAVLLEQIPLAAPLSDLSISSPFGYRPNPWTGAREFHVGVDLRGPVGMPVYATAPGMVSFAGAQTGYGNIVIIDHGFGLSTRYSHLSKILVRVGTDVDLHQVIGLLGNTGWSTGPHLLYETRVDGQPHDPLAFMKVNVDGVQK